MMQRPLAVVVAGLDGRQIEHHQLKVGGNLAAQIIDMSADRWDRSSIYVYRNSIDPDNLIPLDVVPTIPVAPNDFYVVRATPAQGAIQPILMAAALTAVAVLTAGVGVGLLVGGTALAGYMAASLIPTPNLPSSETSRDQASGLNTLGVPTNRARLGSRIADIYGRMRIYPDLRYPAIEDWSGRTQKVTALYTIGVGFYDINSYRLGETIIDALPGVTVTQYDPGHTMPQLLVQRVTQSQQQIDLTENGSDGGPYTAWVTCVGDQIKQIWMDIGFPSGLVVYKSSGGTRNETTKIRIDYQRLDVADTVHSVDVTFNEGIGNPLRYTTKITNLNAGTYQVRARRLDDGTHGDDDVHVSGCALVRVAGIEILPLASRATNRATFVLLTIDNNDQVAQLSAITFNLIVKRRLRLLLGDTPDTDLVATSFLRDALYHVLSDTYLGKLPDSYIDIHGIQSLHAKLKAFDDGEAAEFNGVFDRWTSVDEMVQTIAQIARGGAVYDGGRIVVMRDEDKPAPISVFNRRVRPVDDQSTRVSSFLTPDQEDGVSIDWMDSDNQWVPRTYIYPEDAINPKSITLTGATHWSQVYRRAVYEYDRMVYRRRTYKVTVTEEGRICNPLDIITVIDPWLDPICDGDVINYDSTTRKVTLDQKVLASAGKVLRVRSLYGDLTDDIPIVAKTSASSTVVLQRDPLVPIGGRDAQHQVGSLWVMATVGFLEEHDWHVVDMNIGDGKTIDLNLIEYTSLAFRCDSVDVPDPPPLQDVAPGDL